MLEGLKQKVYEANMELPRRGLIACTWGNVGGVGREKGLFIIEPSGMDYDILKPFDMMVMDLEGNKVEGEMNPPPDITTHVELYNTFKEVGSIVHTRSPHATTWAQAGRALPCCDTIHADYFYGEIPCTRNLTAEEIEEGYEMNTERVITKTFQGKDPVHIPAVLYENHGPFTWGKDAAEAVRNAVVLEEIARMSFMTEFINPQAGPAPQCTQGKHFMCKHKPNAYYGQGE